MVIATKPKEVHGRGVTKKTLFFIDDPTYILLKGSLSSQQFSVFKKMFK